MPRMPARVFAAILADDAGRLTARELAERLAVSPAAVSGAVRYLTQAGMVGRGARAGRAATTTASTTTSGTSPTRTAARCCAAGSRRWPRAPRRSARPPAGRRLAETREFFAFLREELPALMERWRARQPTRRAP